jgi:hypothetical protein
MNFLVTSVLEGDITSKRTDAECWKCFGHEISERKSDP